MVIFYQIFFLNGFSKKTHNLKCSLKSKPNLDSRKELRGKRSRKKNLILHLLLRNLTTDVAIIMIMLYNYSTSSNGFVTQ